MKRADALRMARLAAVQALYQSDITPIGEDALLSQFQERSDSLGEASIPQEGWAHFRDLLLGARREETMIDEALAKHLSADWRLSRLDRTLRAILRAGAYEILRLPHVPVKAAIHEYVGIAHAFFDDSETGFVNGVLDALAKGRGNGIKNGDDINN